MRILITGAGGQLGAYVLEVLGQSGHTVTAWSRAERSRRGQIELRPVEITSELLEAELTASDPEVVIHLAAMSTAEGVRLDPERGERVNVEATRQIADWCREKGRGLVFTSTDLVFPGTKAWNCEIDRPDPVLAYGRTKSAAEPFVLTVSRGLVARVALLYGSTKSGKEGYFDRTMSVRLCIWQRRRGRSSGWPRWERRASYMWLVVSA